MGDIQTKGPMSHQTLISSCFHHGYSQNIFFDVIFCLPGYSNISFYFHFSYPCHHHHHHHHDHDHDDDDEQFADVAVAFCKQISDCTPGKRALRKQSAHDDDLMMIHTYERSMYVSLSQKMYCSLTITITINLPLFCDQNKSTKLKCCIVQGNSMCANSLI